MDFEEIGRIPELLNVAGYFPVWDSMKEVEESV
jgi:hypothetical protein